MGRDVLASMTQLSFGLCLESENEQIAMKYSVVVIKLLYSDRKL